MYWVLEKDGEKTVAMTTIPEVVDMVVSQYPKECVVRYTKDREK